MSEATQVAIMVYPGMTALDALGPYEVLHNHPNIDLRFVWKEVGPIVTDSQVLVIGATHAFSETRRPDVILIPGSSADTATMMADADVLEWIRSAHPHTRFTTSVCSGALILAAAGVLDGHPATTHWMVTKSLLAFGAEPRPHDRVVRSGKIITAAGVSAGIDMALSLLAELEGEQAAKISQLLIEYDPQPPFDCGHVSKADPELIAEAKRQMLAVAANPRDLVSVPTVLLRRFKDVIAKRVRGGKG